MSEILGMIGSHKISVDEGIKKIKEHNTPAIPANHIEKSHFIKIFIKDKDKVNLNLPPIPIFLINTLLSLGFGLAGLFKGYISEEVKVQLDKIDVMDLKELINNLKFAGKSDIVDVVSGGTRVRISLV